MNTQDVLIFDVTVEDFNEKVIEASMGQPVMVDFWAEWCPPCITLAPVLSKIVREYDGGLLLGKVEVDDNMKLAGQYSVRGFPTVILFDQGKEVSRFSGAKPHDEVRGFLAEHLV